jgi:hypothetical protein
MHGRGAVRYKQKKARRCVTPGWVRSHLPFFLFLLVSGFRAARAVGMRALVLLLRVGKQHVCVARMGGRSSAAYVRTLAYQVGYAVSIRA